MGTRSSTKTKASEKTTYAGTKYGMWTVIEEVIRDKGQHFRCVCDCGIERIVAAITLRNGTSKSCGCTKRSKTAKSNIVELRKASRRSIEAFEMIAEGFLPLADLITEAGEPVWSFESIAKILGTNPKELESLLRKRGNQFNPIHRHSSEPV